MFEAKAEAEAKALRPRPRPRPNFGLEDLTYTVYSSEGPKKYAYRESEI